MDNLGENENIDKKATSKIQKTSPYVSTDEEPGDVLNIDTNEAMVITELPSQKRARANLPSECQELLQRITNVTFDVEESSEVFVELKETLNELLQKLYDSRKKRKMFNIQMKKNNSTINSML